MPVTDAPPRQTAPPSAAGSGEPSDRDAGSRSWSSPGGRPRQARPLLVVLAAVAAAGYAWRLDGAPLHPYYGPAVQSMSSSWRSWWFGAVDPDGTITLDKLPGAFQLQALSARVFGLHHWSILLPQVVAAVAAICVLYRLVRRWHSPAAGMLAATALATTPIVTVLARSQVPDMLLVTLLLVAAGAWHRAVTSGRLLPLLACGLTVGLAFGVKMTQAWGLLPVLGILHLVAAPNRLRARVAHLALAAATALVASSPWIATMLLVPVGRRPYIDGTLDDSPLAMVFGYNTLGRFGFADADGIGHTPPAGYVADGVPLGWKTMVSAPIATQAGWLYPLALLGLVAGLVWRGRAARTDQLRAGYLLWAGWLGVYGAAFTVGSMPHRYYAIAVAPPVAALAAAGMVSLWSWRAHPLLRWAVPAAVGGAAAWSWHLAAAFPEPLSWLPPTVLVSGAVATVGTATMVRLGSHPFSPHEAAARRAAPRVAGLIVAAAAAVAVFGGSATWAATTQDGVAATPVAGTPRHGEPAAGAKRPGPLLRYLNAHRDGRRYLLAAQGSRIARRYASAGSAVLTLGGYSGNVPFPAPARLADLIEGDHLRYVQLGAHGNRRSAIGVWVRDHCAPVDPAAYGQAGDLALYDCARTRH